MNMNILNSTLNVALLNHGRSHSIHTIHHYTKSVHGRWRSSERIHHFYNIFRVWDRNDFTINFRMQVGTEWLFHNRLVLMVDFYTIYFRRLMFCVIDCLLSKVEHSHSLFPRLPYYHYQDLYARKILIWKTESGLDLTWRMMKRLKNGKYECEKYRVLFACLQSFRL